MLGNKRSRLSLSFGEGGGSALADLRAKQVAEDKEYREKVELSFDEKKLGEGLSNFFAEQLPENKKVDKSKHPSALTAIQAAFDDDDPRKSLIPVVKENFQTLLRDKNAIGLDEGQLLSMAYDATVKGTPSDKYPGRSYEDEIHKYKYKKDTALFFGKGNVGAAPGYEEWLEKERVKPIEDRMTGLGASMLEFAGINSALSLLKRPLQKGVGHALTAAGAAKLGGKFLTWGAGPQGKILGVALVGALEAIPFHFAGKALEKTDWYRAREGDDVQQTLAHLAVGGLASTAAYKTVGKQTLGALKIAAEKGAVTEGALKLFFKDQTAENIMAVGAARKAERAAIGRIDGLLSKASEREKELWFDSIESSERNIFKKYTDEDALAGTLQKREGELGRILERDYYGKTPQQPALPPGKIKGELPEPAFLERKLGASSEYTQRSLEEGTEQLALPGGVPRWKQGTPVTPGGRVLVRPPKDERVFTGSPNEAAALEAGAEKLALPQGLGKREGLPVTPAGRVLGTTVDGAVKETELVYPSLAKETLSLTGKGVPQLPAAAEKTAQFEGYRFGPSAKIGEAIPLPQATGLAGNGGVANLKPAPALNTTAQQKKAFTSLPHEDAVSVIDKVSSKGKSLPEALKEVAETKELKKALNTTDEAASKVGRQKAIETEIQQGQPEILLRKNQEKKATQAAVKEASDAIKKKAKEEKTALEKVSEKSKNDPSEKELDVVELAKLIGSKSWGRTTPATKAGEMVAKPEAPKVFAPSVEKKLVKVPLSSEERIAQDYAGVKKGDRPYVEYAEVEASQVGKAENPLDFVKVAEGKLSSEEYVKNLMDPEYRRKEATELYTMMEKRGMTQDEIYNSKAYYMMKGFMQQATVAGESVETGVAAEYLLQRLSAVSDDAAGVGTATAEQMASRKIAANALKGIIPLGAVGLVALNGDEAEAGVMGAAAKAVAKEVPAGWVNTVKSLREIAGMPKETVGNLFKGLVKEMEDAGFVGKDVGMSKVLPQRMKVPDFMGIVKDIYGTTYNAVKRADALPFGLERLMTPYGKANLHYKPGANPGVHIGAMQTAAGYNTQNAYKALNNIMGEVYNGGSNSQELIKMFKPLADEYSGVVTAHSLTKTKITQLEKAAAALEKGLKSKKVLVEEKGLLQKKLGEVRNELGEYKVKMETHLSKDYAEYVKAHDVLLKEAAQKFPSTRVFLAAEDTEAFAHYPWLKNIITTEEKEAAVYLKGMMKTYEEALVESELKVITDRPYMHYAWHPSWRESNAARYAEKIGLELPVTTVPNNQFHHRIKGSLPMVPDAQYSVQMYVPEAERILGWRQFWNKGGERGLSWYKHMQSSTVQNNSALRSMWNAIKDASIPTQQFEVDKWADRYTAFEAFRLLSASPSVAYKHFFKNIGTWGSLGFGEAASHIGTAVSTAVRTKAMSGEGQRFFSAIGLDTSKLNKKFYDDAARSMTTQMRRMSILDDMDLKPSSSLGWLDNFLGNVNHHTGFMVRAVESYDRMHSFLAAAEMSAKQGLTARDASYAIFDTIIKNNFLGGALNPSWAKSPVVRAVTLFQTTAFKIFERRLVSAVQSGTAIKKAWRSAADLGWDWDKAMHEMKTLKDFIVSGEYEFKKGIITDALASERDFLGQFTVRQSMRELLYAGIVLGGGAAMEHDYSHHVSHLPFVGTSQDGEPVVGLSPIARALWDTKEGKVYNGEESEFGLVGDFLNNWLRSQGPIPLMMRKYINVTEDDIPSQYRDEGFLPKEFRYFFSIPSTKEKD